MITEVAKIIGTEVIKIITANTIKKIKPEIFESNKKLLDDFKIKFPELYEQHFNEITKWATTIPFIGLSKPKVTNSSTIELLIASDIIKRNNEKVETVNEFEILDSLNNIILIGAPGAGKTTTLKRLILKYLSELNKFTNTGFPVLIRLRDVSPETTLLKYFLDIFSIKYEDKLVKYEKKIRKVSKKTGDVTYQKKVEEKIETFIGETSIINFVCKFLNQSNCLLMLDGLDELDKSIQSETLRTIESMGLKLNSSKILMTVRKSELNKVIENFTAYEISPLTEKQIVEISCKWSKKSKEFISELGKRPYKDLANRPIFLTLLLILFDKFAFLPTQPSEVYEDATFLIIKDWDEHRDIIRHSIYSDFNTRKKLKFISELSYYLTYKIKQKVFSSKDLQNIYCDIYEKYGLPVNEMKKVVSEIESHTGLITESNYKNFEFSHLSIQEYLCAKHLVNLPYSKETIDYFFEYAEPLAIAICISGDPSQWFSNLILNSSLNINNFKSNRNPYYSSIYTLLNRLLVERPSFKTSIELGFTFFYLITNLYDNKDFISLLDDWFKYENVKKSISISLKGCTYKDTLNGTYLFARKSASATNYFISIPTQGELPKRYIENLIEVKLINLVNDKVE